MGIFTIKNFHYGLASLFVATFVAIAGIHSASAAPAGWNAEKIIDDVVFTNASSMSVGQIQSFLASKVPTCDTNGNQQSEMNNSGVPDYNGNGSIQRWEWGKAKYNQTVFTCLKDYNEAGKGSAQIIYDVSQKYTINPQVLIVLLQKEQGLVTDTWPIQTQYRSATGYGCPDTAPCDTQYYGLTNQLDWAAKMFRSIINNSPGWYTPYVLGNNYVQYNPDSRCGGSTINIRNRSTQALYNYTPYQPNSYALEGGSQSGYPSCGAFGNRNFYTYFTSWFGNTFAISDKFLARWTQLGGDNGQLGKPVEAESCTLRDSGCYQKFQWGYLLWSPATGGWENIGHIRDRWTQIGGENGQLGYPTGGEACTATGCTQTYQGGRIVWSKVAGAWENIGAIKDRWIQLGEERGKLGYPVEGERCGTKDGGCYQKFERGYMVWTGSTGAWENIGAIRSRWMQLGGEYSNLGYPTEAEQCTTTGCSQKYQTGYLIWSGATGAWEHGLVTNTRWGQLGAGSGRLGYPLEGEKCGLKDSGCYQKFKGGYIIRSSATGAWETFGAIRAKWMQLGGENGELGYPTAGETCTQSSCSQVFQGGTILWDQAQGARLQ